LVAALVYAVLYQLEQEKEAIDKGGFILLNVFLLAHSTEVPTFPLIEGANFVLALRAHLHLVAH
jgi:hypothetical protein